MHAISCDKNICAQCGICVSVCPVKIIHLVEEGSHPTQDPDFEEYCIECGHCVAVCPTGAFSLDRLSPDDCKAIRKDLQMTPEQVEQLLNARRSTRAYKELTVPRDILEKLLQVGSSAPSAKNVQPWCWIVIQTPGEVRRVASMVIDWMKSVIHEMPEAKETVALRQIVATWDNNIDRICRGAPHLIIAHADKNWGFATEDCVLALSHVALYAPSVGLGTCWAGYVYKTINVYPPLFEALGLPSDHLAYGAMMVGYPMHTYQRIPPRKQPRIVWR